MIGYAIAGGASVLKTHGAGYLIGRTWVSTLLGLVAGLICGHGGFVDDARANPRTTKARYDPLRRLLDPVPNRHRRQPRGRVGSRQ